MPETLETNYHLLPDADQEAASWKKFSVIEAGKTQGAHLPIVAKLKSIGQTEVSREESDYLVVFCPVASRVGTDISEALETIQGNKPIILVVMHHTYNPQHVVADSRRQVNNRNVHLTVDCLFHEGRLLTCNRNDIAWFEIQKVFGVSASQVSICNRIINWLRNNRMVTAVVHILMIVVSLVLGLLRALTRK